MSNRWVAIARALTLDPRYVSFDEPTTSLDPVSARRVDQLIRELSDSLGVTSIVVSHDLASIFAIADRIVMIYGGGGGGCWARPPSSNSPATRSSISSSTGVPRDRSTSDLAERERHRRRTRARIRPRPRTPGRPRSRPQPRGLFLVLPGSSVIAPDGTASQSRRKPAAPPARRDHCTTHWSATHLTSSPSIRPGQPGQAGCSHRRRAQRFSMRSASWRFTASCHW